MPRRLARGVRRIAIIAAVTAVALPVTVYSPSFADPAPVVDSASPAPTVPPVAEEASLLPTPQDAAAVPGVLGLLPWDMPASPTGAEQALMDAADADYDPDTTDEAVVLYETIQRENLLAQQSAQQIPAARAAATTARAASDEATASAIAARDKAAVSSQKMDNAIRETYMRGGVVPFSGLVYAVDPRSAIGALETEAQLLSVTQYTVDEAQENRRLSAEADARAAQSLQQAQQAEARVTDLETETRLHQEAAEAAAKAYTKYIDTMAASSPQAVIGPDGCPTSVPEGVLRGGSSDIGAQALCQKSVMLAATPQAALAIKWAFSKLGAPYACKGVGRMEKFRFDCSSLVSRAYFHGAGIPVAGDTWAPSTRNMMPWDGVRLDPHYEEVPSTGIMPGDLILTRSCTSEPCAYQHVTMALADGFILHTNSCGDVAHITANPGYGPGSNFVVGRRVVLLPGEQIPELLLTAAQGDQQAQASDLQSVPVTPDPEFPPANEENATTAAP